jgi:hypothetical protein
MITLDDAWKWYEITRAHMLAFARLGSKHWDALPWDGQLGRDEKLKNLESNTIVEGAKFCLEPLDDLAVLVLFSVFESEVRDRVLSEVQAEKVRLGHPFLTRIVEDAVQDIEHGSFARLLDIFKGRGEEFVGLIEEVNQVRRYRNWVAHGRRTDQPDAVDPRAAFERLKRFLQKLVGPKVLP